MDREGFRNRLKQYKKAREENPGLKYWEWKAQPTEKDIPKYDEGTNSVQINSGIPWWLMVINSGEKVQPLTQTDIERYENNELQRKLARSKYIMGVLSDIGASGKNPIKAIYNPTTGGDQQDVFLLNTKDQQRVMEQRGWKKIDTRKEGDPYGIVRTGAKYHLNKHSEVPVYENTADSDTTINREQLTKLFNVSNDIIPGTDYFGNAGSYDSVIYIDKNTGKFYSRSYDLNDYGPTQQSNGFISTVGDLKRKAAEKLDEIGTPFVIRTGFVPLNDYSIQHIANQNQKYKLIIDDAKASVGVSKILKKAEGGEVDPRQLILNRADTVYSNYSDARDFDLDPITYTARKLAKTLFGRGGISNCTLSATKWVDPNNQYMSAKNIFNNPDSGYTEISKDYVLPGDLLITKVPGKDSYHTMLVEGFNGDEPILRYSKGGHDTENNLVTGRPLTLYHKLDKLQGGNHDEDHYFRYNLPNEYWLPEITVTPTKYAEGTDQVEPDPLEVLEKSRPRVGNIPINDRPLSGTDPIGEAMLWGLGGGAASVALRSLFPTYGATAAWLAFGDNNKDNMLVIPNNPTKNTTPIETGLLNKEVRQYYADDVLPRDILTAEADKLKFLNTDKNFEYDLYPQGYFANGVVGHYDRMNDVIRLNGGYITDKDLLDNVMSHEVNHRYNREFPLDKEHNRILNRAYTVEPKLNTAAARAARKESEKRATNVNIRHKLQTDLRNTLGRKPTKTEMDKFIDSLSDLELLDRLGSASSYGSAYLMSIEERSDLVNQPADQYKKARITALRKALKYVAMNENKNDNNQNYA